MQQLFKDKNNHIYEQKLCVDCGHQFLARQDAVGNCPICTRTSRRSPFDLSDPEVKRTYNSYYSMLSRCLNSKHKDFPNYGGRGVCVHPAWADSFESFVADMGMRPEGTSLDRKRPNGHYTPGNCRWASQHTQNQNKRHRYESLWSKVLKPQADK
jgi:hypothetical protein